MPNQNNKLKETPVITYQKWWHRFIPRYRRNIKLMNVLLDSEWANLESETHQRAKELIMYGKTKIGNRVFYYEDFFNRHV